MISSKVSPKYQIVIPKELRVHLKLRPGQRVYLAAKGPDELVLAKHPDIEQYLGVLESAEDPVAYQRRIRADKSYL